MRSLLLNVDFVETGACLMHPCFADEPCDSLTLLFFHREMTALFFPSLVYKKFRGRQRELLFVGTYVDNV